MERLRSLRASVHAARSRPDDRFSSIFTHTKTGRPGYFKQINPAWARTLGYAEEELLAKPYLDFVHPDDVAPTIGAAARVSNGVTVLEFRNRYRAKDGTYRWLAWNAFPSPEEQLVYACARDITDLKRHEDLQRPLTL